MSKLTNSVKSNKKNDSKSIVNYMGGKSYIVNPIDTLKIVTSSSIFGEPSYYRNGEFANKYSEKKIFDEVFITNSAVSKYDIVANEYIDKTTSEVMELVIDDALGFDFKATLEWALELRTNFNMRLNPQVIMVRAAMHKKRQEFTKSNPGLFNEINKKVMSRLDEPATQLTYWLYKNKSKSGIPSILKKSWANKYENANKYQLAKYKNSGIGMIDTMRICHPVGDKQPAISELLLTGSIKINENNTTWENLRSNGKTWFEILSTIQIGHMSLLRNLRNIFTEIEDEKLCNSILEQLVNGVETGKQFPFRYYTAKKVIEKSNVNFKSKIIDVLENCIDESTKNLPKLKGRTMCLSDNSGSAWGTFNSEYGSVTIADIANLSSVITAKNSEEGYVGVFGNKVNTKLISQKSGILMQHELINELGKGVGMATEGGLWEFFINAINKKEHWDNIFIYSDMQAGHGQLFGTSEQEKQYRKLGYSTDYSCIDLMKVIETYRENVNPKVNIYTVQVAGYDNVILPENLYRTSVLSGWTGKELLYASYINNIWDEIDSRNEAINDTGYNYEEVGTPIYQQFIDNIRNGNINEKELDCLEKCLKQAFEKIDSLEKEIQEIYNL